MLVALGSSSRVLARAVPCSARLSTVVASEAAFGIDSFFTPIYPQDSFSLAQTDKKVFTEVFEMCKAATLGKKVPLKKGGSATGLSEADIKGLDLAEQFLARKMRLQALKFRDYLTETGKLDAFEKLTADQAWKEKEAAGQVRGESFLIDFSQGKIDPNAATFASLPEWGKEVLSEMKQDESYVAEFTQANPKSAKNMSDAIDHAMAAQQAGGVVPTVAEAKDPNSCLYTIEGTPEYDFQWRWMQNADMISRTPQFEYQLTAEDKAFCESYNKGLVAQYKQFFEEGDKIEVPDKVTFGH